MFYAINAKKPIKIILLLIILAIAAAMGWFALNTLYPLKYTDIITKYAKEYNLSPAFVASVIHAESRFDEMALSKKGAGGLMQIMDPTAYWLAQELGMDDFTPEQVFDPDTNIKLGCYYLRKLLNQYDGDVTVALAAYNAGSGTVANWLDDSRYSRDGSTLSYIPYVQTRTYIKKIEKYIKVYNIVFKVIKKG